MTIRTGVICNRLRNAGSVATRSAEELTDKVNARRRKQRERIVLPVGGR
jgi:hypothetical protein